MSKDTAKRKASEQEFEFTLTLGGVTELTTAVEDAIFEAGCDDSTLLWRWSRLFASFNRSATSLEKAVTSAVQDVLRAKIGATVLSVSPSHLVTQAEIARRIDRTRASVNQLAAGTRGPGGFPAPVAGVDDESPLWRWVEVAAWLNANGMIDEQAVEDAAFLDRINVNLAAEWPRPAAKSPMGYAAWYASTG